MIVLDGFRPDYLQDNEFMQRFKNNASSAENVYPVFPSSRLPNVASLITGLYSERHNVTADEVVDGDGNVLYDAKDERFWAEMRAKYETIWDIYGKDPAKAMEIINLPEKDAILAKLKKKQEAEDDPVNVEAVKSTVDIG